MSASPRWRLVPTGLTAAALALAMIVLAACAGTHSSTPTPPASAPSVRSAPGTPDTRGPADSAPSSVTPDAAGTAPVRIQIPSIDVDSSLQPLGLTRTGTLETPSRWQRAGWFAKGVRPGAIGPAVIAGHVDSTSGPAVFFRLRQLRPGASVLVTRRDGTVLRFRVDRSERFEKRAFPTAAVYGPASIPILRLVTCTGDFDASAHSYVDNLVVTTSLVTT